MRNNSFPSIVLLVMLLCLSGTLYASSAEDSESIEARQKEARFLIPNRSQNVYDLKLVQTEDWTELYRVPEHPAFDSLLTPEKEKEILAQINQRRREHGSDTLLTADYFYIWRPYFDWMNYIDPHYRIYPVPSLSKEDYKSGRQFNKDERSRQLGFNTFIIGDTVIINQSFDPQFKVGDMITSINGVTMPEYLKYGYSDRYSSPLHLMLYYYFSFAVDHFSVKLQRDGQEMEIETAGTQSLTLQRELRAEEYNVKTYSDAKCGYVQVRRFYPHNGRVLKTVRNAIREFKKQGCNNVIIDIRKNKGGSGHSFDKLLSIFIDKPSIPYMLSERLMVSEKSLGDYDFLTEEMIGTVIEKPDYDIVKEVELNPKRYYVDGMNYYILVSKDTGSIAASFANILHYNGAATIVGEPLLHNALKYGEADTGNYLWATTLVETAVSTTEMNEHTNAVNGVLMPDIHIPYVAKEYLSGKDAVLERLLEIIKKENN